MTVAYSSQDVRGHLLWKLFVGLDFASVFRIILYAKAHWKGCEAVASVLTSKGTWISPGVQDSADLFRVGVCVEAGSSPTVTWKDFSPFQKCPIHSKATARRPAEPSECAASCKQATAGRGMQLVKKNQRNYCIYSMIDYLLIISYYNCVHNITQLKFNVAGCRQAEEGGSSSSKPSGHWP